MHRVSKDILVKVSLSVVSGLLIAFLFPNFNLEFLAWFAFIPLFYTIRISKGFKESLFTAS